MLFMVIETFKPGAIKGVYQRFRDRGRMLPEGVTYVNSWVTSDLRHCYQVMSCERREQLEEWIARWSDLVEFELVPVMTSAEASQKTLGEG